MYNLYPKHIHSKYTNIELLYKVAIYIYVLAIQYTVYIVTYVCWIYTHVFNNVHFN